MADHILFVTGRLAESRLHSVLTEMGATDFSWEIRQIGVKVAGLMTTEIVSNRLGEVGGATKVVLPGRCRGDIAILSAQFGVPFERGPDDLADLPEHFGRKASRAALLDHSVRIFAEIVDASTLKIDAIVAKAKALKADGADVIDLGCLPGTVFPHLDEAVAELVRQGLTVSVDSLDPAELKRGSKAGASYLLSLTAQTLDLAFEVEATPILIPAKHGDMDELVRSWETLAKQGKRAIVDPILDPIMFGFSESLCRFQSLRDRLPEAEMLMGIGNVTELTDADTTGITAILMAAVQEMGVGNVLVVQVSPHCRLAVRETDWARRIMYHAQKTKSLPQRISPALMGLRDRRPYASTPAQIAQLAAEVTDRNWRIEVAEDGIHVFNKDGHWVATDPYELWPHLNMAADGSHAFYLGAELAKAQIAWSLGKRYVQDRPLNWGIATDPEPESRAHRNPGHDSGEKS
jgi:dihydropteroate synthase-like protein